MKRILKHFKRVASRSERGVALLFVILLTSVLLLVSIGIANISYRETVFSIQARDSDRAFFAADTGIECGLYLDKLGYFSGGGTGSPTCNGAGVPIPTGLTIYNFAVPITSPSGPTCAQVTVDKDLSVTDALTGTTSSYTAISSIGYNVAVSGSDPTLCGPGTTDLRIITRALRIQYPNGGSSTTTTGTGGGGGGGGGTSTAPLVTTDSAVGVTDTSATLVGTLTIPSGGDPVTLVGFTYTDIGSGSSATVTNAGTFSDGDFTIDVTGLACDGARYSVKAFARNAAGEYGYGTPVSFTTDACGV